MMKNLCAGLLSLCLFAIGIQANGQNSSVADTSIVRSLIDSAIFHNDKGIEPLRAIDFAVKALDLSKVLNSDYFIGRANIEIAQGYFTTRDLQKTESYAASANEMATKLDDIDLKIEAIGLLANVAAVRGEFEVSLNYYEKILYLAEQAGSQKALADIRGNMGHTLWEMGDYERSMKLVYQANDYYKEQGLERLLAISYNNIGEQYRSHFNDYEKANEYYMKATAINERLGDWRALHMNLGNMTLSLMELKRYDTVQIILDQCEELEKKGENITAKAHRLNNQGSLYLQLKDFDAARQCFQQVKEICQSNGLLIGVFYSTIGLGAVADSLGQYDLGRQYFDSLALLAQMSGSPEIRTIAHRHLYSHFKLRGDAVNALVELEKFQELNDTLQTKKSERQIAGLRIGYETAIKEKENETLIADSKVKEAKIKYQQGIQLAAFIVIALLLLLAALLYRSSLLRNKAYKTVNEQKKELEKKNIALAEMDHLKNTVFSVVAHDLRGPVANVKGMLDVMDLGVLSEDEQRTVTQSLKKDVKQTLVTMENLLVWARSQMSGTPPKPTVFDLSAVATECISLLAANARDKDIEVRVIKERPISVFADEEQVRSILRNLLSNAIKFSKVGKQVNIVLSENRDMCIIEVQDTGVGFTDTMLQNIHDSSFAVSTRGTKGESGTGIGLQVVREFVNSNNGNFKVANREEGGAVVTIELPKRQV